MVIYDDPGHYGCSKINLYITLKLKCCHFDEFSSLAALNFQCGQWRKLDQNDIFFLMNHSKTQQSAYSVSSYATCNRQIKRLIVNIM